MTMHWKPAALAAAVLLSAATGAAAADAKAKAPSIDGVWKVAHVEITGANPLTVAKPLASLYIFSRGHYALVQETGDTPRTASPALKTPGKPTDAEKLARYEEWAPFGAQAGTYVVKGDKLTRTPVVAKGVGAVTAGAYDTDLKLTAESAVLTGHAAAGQPARETKITLTRVK
jgi:hypothetical protein